MASWHGAGSLKRSRQQQSAGRVSIWARCRRVNNAPAQTRVRKAQDFAGRTGYASLACQRRLRARSGFSAQLLYRRKGQARCTPISAHLQRTSLSGRETNRAPESRPAGIGGTSASFVEAAQPPGAKNPDRSGQSRGPAKIRWLTGSLRWARHGDKARATGAAQAAGHIRPLAPVLAQTARALELASGDWVARLGTQEAAGRRPTSRAEAARLRVQEAAPNHPALCFAVKLEVRGSLATYADHALGPGHCPVLFTRRNPDHVAGFDGNHFGAELQPA